MSHDHENPTTKGKALPSRVQVRQSEAKAKHATMTALIGGLILLVLVAPALFLAGYLFTTGGEAESTYISAADPLYVDESGEYSLVPAPDGPVPDSCTITSGEHRVTLQHVGSAFVASALPSGTYTVECTGEANNTDYRFISPNPRSHVAAGNALGFSAALVAALGMGLSLWAGMRLYRAKRDA